MAKGAQFRGTLATTTSGNDAGTSVGKAFGFEARYISISNAAGATAYVDITTTSGSSISAYPIAASSAQSFTWWGMRTPGISAISTSGAAVTTLTISAWA